MKAFPFIWGGPTGHRLLTPMQIIKHIGIVSALLKSGWALAQQPPDITQQPTNTTVQLGVTAQFKVVAEAGSAPLAEYHWWFKDAPLDASVIPSAAWATLNLAKVTIDQTGPYFVVVSDAAGLSVTSQVAVLSIGPPHITMQPTNATVSLGATAQFTVSVRAADPPITFRWHFKDAPLDAVANPSVAARILSLTNVTLACAGPYFVVASNVLGMSSTSQVAVLDVDPTFTKIMTGPPVTDWGCTWGGSGKDYNDDGFDDLIVVRANLGKSAVYRSQGDGTFTSEPYSSWGVLGAPDLWGDLDSDGCLDLLTYRADFSGVCVNFGIGDGTFDPITANLPLRTTAGNPALVDFDQDGMLDLFTPAWSLTTNSLYRNTGDRTFRWMTKEDVGSVCAFKTHGGASWADYDDDGWIDLYSANNGSPSRLHHNLGGGRFAEVPNQVRQTSLNGDWGDYDNDGLIDLCFTLWTEGTPRSVFRNLGDSTFELVPTGDGIAGTWNNSATWVDFDNDGFLDLFRTQGIAPPNGTGKYTLARNNGDGTFSRITTGSIAADTPPNGSSSYAGVWFDFNNDGFMDLYTINGDDSGTIDTRNFLYQNNGNANAWLKVKLIGTVSNRDAVGAKVRVQARFAGQVRWQRRDIAVGDFWNFNHPYAHFGLGDATVVDLVRVEWPSGLVQELTNVRVKQTLTVTEHQDGVKTAPSLTATRLAEGAVQLTLTGDKNFLYVFEGSTDLAKWMKLGVRTNETGTVEFTDIHASRYPHRFYRGIAP